MIEWRKTLYQHELIPNFLSTHLLPQKEEMTRSIHRSCLGKACHAKIAYINGYYLHLVVSLIPSFKHALNHTKRFDDIVLLRRSVLLEKAMVEGLVNPNHRVRMRTIYMLVEHGHAEAVPFLLPLLHDREMPVRNAAIVALGTFADQQAFAPLVAHLTAPISLERKNAVLALVALEDSRREDAFLEALKTERNPSVRVELIKALSVFPDEKVLETLIERLTDEDGDVRAVTAIALGKMGLPRAIPALQQMALTDTNQETSIHGLSIQNSSIAKQAIQMLLHPDQEQAIDWPDY